jgi:hypothetical protein
MRCLARVVERRALWREGAVTEMFVGNNRIT